MVPVEGASVARAGLVRRPSSWGGQAIFRNMGQNEGSRAAIELGQGLDCCETIGFRTSDGTCRLGESQCQAQY